MATYVPKQLGQAVLATTMTDFYIATTYAVILKGFIFCNLTSNTVKVSIAMLLNGDTLGNKNYLFSGSGLTLQPGETRPVNFQDVILPIGAKIQMMCDGASAVACTASGVEIQ